VKITIIASSVFSEVGAEGKERECLIVQIARRAGMHLVGPNMTGIANTANNFTMSFVALPRLTRGPVTFIAQRTMDVVLCSIGVEILSP